MKFLLLTALLAGVEGKIYFQEKFTDGWKDRWTVPTSWKSVR